MKQTTIDNIHHSNISYNRGDGKGYLSANYFAPSTTKQHTSNNKYEGNVHSSVNNKGGYTSNDFYAPATLKQLTSNKSYEGSANSANKKETSYNSAYNARTNSLREKISKGRAPTQNNVKVVNGSSNMKIVNKKQNAKYDNSTRPNVSNINQQIVSKDISATTTVNSKALLSNKNNKEWINPNNLLPLNNNPYALSINREVKRDKIIDVTDTDSDFEDFI